MFPVVTGLSISPRSKRCFLFFQSFAKFKLDGASSKKCKAEEKKNATNYNISYLMMKAFFYNLN